MRCSGEGQEQNIAFYNQCVTDFNDEQRKAFNIIAACLADNYEGIMVLNINAPGGCGKILLLNAILGYARGWGRNGLQLLFQVLQQHFQEMVVQQTVHSVFPFQYETHRRVR